MHPPFQLKLTAVTLLNCKLLTMMSVLNIKSLTCSSYSHCPVQLQKNSNGENTKEREEISLEFMLLGAAHSF